MRYRLIGLDLDGTLLTPDGEISRANREAIARAQAAGALVVPCTGRAWHEAAYLFNGTNETPGVPGIGQGVFITGACVADMKTGASVDLALMEPHVAWEAVELLKDEADAVLVFRESALAGHHYLVTGNGELGQNTRWWFEVSGAEVHFQRDVTPEDLHHTLRVGMVGEASRMGGLRAKVDAALGGRVLAHHFNALVRDDGMPMVAVLEVFAADAHKWRGLTWVAAQHGIAPHEIAAIGDEVNDLAMLREAGCGVAMANAIPEAKAAARYETKSNKEDGVAHAIDRMLRREW